MCNIVSVTVEHVRWEGGRVCVILLISTDNESNTRVKEKVALSEYQLIFTSLELLLCDANWTDVVQE